MKVALLVVGRAREPFAALDAHYRKLLSGPQPVEVIEVRDDRVLLRRVPGRAHVVAVDRRGRTMDSQQWSRWLGKRRLEARDVCLLIGGPEGLPPEALDAAAESISLGPQTMAHQLARAVVLEQLYRAAKILAGEPYHR